MHVCRKIEIGSIPVELPEFRVEWEGRPIPTPKTYMRRSKMTALAEFCAPDNVLNESWDDIRTCAISAGGVAGVAAIISGPPGALPSFKAAFIACVTAKIGERSKELEVALSAEQQHGDWHRV